MDYIRMGRMIKDERIRMNLTQEEMANAVGISASFMGHIERGSRVASIETIERICIRTGLSADDLFGLNRNEMFTGLSEGKRMLADELMRCIATVLSESEEEKK